MLADCGVTTWGHADMSLYRLYGFERKDPVNRQTKRDFWTREYFHQRRRNLWASLFFLALFSLGLGLLFGRWVVPLVKRLVGM